MVTDREMASASRSYFTQLWVLNHLCSGITGISQNDLAAIGTGITKQSIQQIGIYGVDDKKYCHVGLKLTINWAAQTIHIVVLGVRGAIGKTVSTKDDTPPAVDNAISEFKQALEGSNLRVECYPRYEHDLDPVAGVAFVLPKELEFLQFEDTLKDFSSVNVPSEYLDLLLQHLYDEDVLTQSSQRSTTILPIPVPAPPEPATHVKHPEIIHIDHISDMVSQASLPGEPTQQDKQARAFSQHVEQIREEGKPPQGIIYQRGNLPKNYDTHVTQFVEALGNQQHSLRQPAEYALKRFIEAAAKQMATDKGILIEQASRKFGIPATTLAEWADMGLIPELSRSKGARYLDEEAVAEAAPLYREAKERHVQPVRLLKERRAQQASGESEPSH
jgi:hypothetical protein